MGGNGFVVKALGLLILAVVGVGGVGMIALVSRLELTQLNVGFLFIPWAVVATIAMALMWLGTAVLLFIKDPED